MKEFCSFKFLPQHFSIFFFFWALLLLLLFLDHFPVAWSSFSPALAVGLMSSRLTLWYTDVWLCYCKVPKSWPLLHRASQLLWGVVFSKRGAVLYGQTSPLVVSKGHCSFGFPCSSFICSLPDLSWAAVFFLETWQTCWGPDVLFENLEFSY